MLSYQTCSPYIQVGDNARAEVVNRNLCTNFCEDDHVYVIEMGVSALQLANTLEIPHGLTYEKLTQLRYLYHSFSTSLPSSVNQSRKGPLTAPPYLWRIT